MLESLKEELRNLNLELPKNGLVSWTGGNVSIRDPQTGFVLIKPSGLRYEQMRTSDMIVLNLDGQVLEGNLKPSSDTSSHLFIYRHRPDVNGIVHTHSRFATAFAALGKPIPCVLTAIADEFGGSIPCGPFALIGGEQIGKVVVDYIGNSPAILLKNHGVFTIGKSGLDAVKSAVMTEDVAATVWYALQLGSPTEISPDAIKQLHDRYTNVYGQ